MQERFNQYCPTKQIASKPSRSVYLAHPNNHVSQKVVLKVFDAAYFTSDQQSKNFLQEVERIRQVKHSSIIPILDLGVEQGKPYVVREYLASHSLRHRLDRLSPQRLSLQEALTIIFQVGRVLSYAHQRGIFHGNLKPENIFFNSNGKVLLSDFGFASFINVTKLDDKSNLQTTSYLAPEQLVGSITAKSDQYALACLAYELIAGCAPFSAQSFSSVASLASDDRESANAIERGEGAAKDQATSVQTPSSCENSQCPDYGKVGGDNIRKFGKTRKGVQRWQCKTCRMTWSFSSMEVKHHTGLIPLSDLVPNLPEPIEEVVLKALAKDPAERYANITILLRALQFVLLLPTSVSTNSLIVSPVTPLPRNMTEPLENTENEAPLTVHLFERRKHMENDYQASKVLAIPNPDTYHAEKTVAIPNSDTYHTSKSITKPEINAYRTKKDLAEALPEGRYPQVSKPLPPTLWLAFALSGIVLLLGTVILYTLVPLRSPGSTGPLKSRPTVVPTRTNVNTPTGQAHITPSTQPPVLISLTGSYVDQTNQVYNLTPEGTLDWVHWGLRTVGEVDRKSNVQPQISSYSLIGSGTAQRDGYYSSAYDWSDGTPVTSVNVGADKPSGVYVTGPNNGFAINVPASTTPRTLRVYIGVYKARGKLTASLGGKIYQDASLDMIGSSSSPANNGIYTLVFSSSVPKQILTVQYTVMASERSSGFVSLQSATLQG